MDSLDGRVALIAGGTSGIGEATDEESGERWTVESAAKVISIRQRGIS